MSLNLPLCLDDKMTMVDERDLAWFAGFFEGEGSVMASRPTKRGGVYVTLSAASTDRDVLEKVARLVGGSVSRTPVLRRAPSGKEAKPLWQWYLSKTDEAVRLARAIQPHLGARRNKQIDVALSRQKWADPIPDEVSRFWSRVQDQTPGECRFWTGHIDKYGFGTWVPERTGNRSQAHRYAWKLEFGEVPARLRNTCGYKHCVNVDHWQKDGKS